MNWLRPRIPTLLPSFLGRRTLTTTPYKVTVQGPHVDSEDAPDHRDPLLAQLKDIPKDATILTLNDDPPSDTEWDILGNHFTSVRDLTMDSGFNEDLNDRKMPLHWPLERLQIEGVCGEVTKSPHILQGRLGHLILCFTSEMRFEGPTSDELVAANKAAIAQGEAEAQYSPNGRLQVFSISELAHEWMQAKYSNNENPPLELENRAVEGAESRLRTLEIIENDALDTFQRFSIALPHVVEGLSSLTLRSTDYAPCLFGIKEQLFFDILPQLTNLETLNLSIGEVFKKDTSLPGLFASLPPNLSTLQFRGPLSLKQSQRWEEWVAAFQSPTFLPRLQNLAFVLDLHYTRKDENSRLRLEPAPEDQLRQARDACGRIYDAAKGRGISVQPFTYRWAGGHVCLRPVDGRWVL
ncbi:hypothetical protein BJY04DRAFT_134565 [Aspergillus karnatakaensis]|uniref:uncharacterized protein n=1 Tax=Aspergillus karnatakaensis TaxID=1810916 RepID=UPI003CCDE6EB